MTMAIGARAARWDALHGAAARAWAASEEQQRPTYRETLRHVGLRRGDRVLDVGCATGAFLRLCADRGAAVHGLDVAEGLLALARERVPEAELSLGDLQRLPYDDDTFDLVTGFSSFSEADDVVAGLREAGRVARVGAPVVVSVLGNPELCDLAAMWAAVAPYLPVAEHDDRRRVEELLPQAGLELDGWFDITWSYAYAGPEELVEAMLAAAGAAAVAEPERELALRAAILGALAPCRRPDGGYRVANEWHVVIASA
jgi:SAM-dependent methyltransferase